MLKPLFMVTFMCSLVLVPVLMSAPEQMRERAEREAALERGLQVLSDTLKNNP